MYTQDSYADEIPYWMVESGRPLLVVPYTADVNDHRFSTTPGFNWGLPFFEYPRDAFDVLYAEGERTRNDADRLALPTRRAPRADRRLGASSSTCSSHDRVWFARGIDIAKHWRATFPAPG